MPLFVLVFMLGAKLGPTATIQSTPCGLWTVFLLTLVSGTSGDFTVNHGTKPLRHFPIFPIDLW